MKKQYRVKKSEEIEKIIKEKNYKSNPYITLYKKENTETGHFRYAISVGKKIGNAVERNRIKRLITAVIDNLNIDLDSSTDVFIIARVGDAVFLISNGYSLLFFYMTKSISCFSLSL